jgi:hypothetical protein
LPFDPRFAGTNPADGDGFLRAIKILRPHVQKFTACQINLRSMKRYFVRPNSFPSLVHPALLIDDYW